MTLKKLVFWQGLIWYDVYNKKINGNCSVPSQLRVKIH